MEAVTRVVLALDAPEVLDELLHFLDRSGVGAGLGDRRATRSRSRPPLVISSPTSFSRSRGLLRSCRRARPASRSPAGNRLRRSGRPSRRALPPSPSGRSNAMSCCLACARSPSTRRRPRASRDRGRGARGTRRRRLHVHRDTSRAGHRRSRDRYVRPAGRRSLGRRCGFGARHPRGSRTASIPSTSSRGSSPR